MKRKKNKVQFKILMTLIIIIGFIMVVLPTNEKGGVLTQITNKAKIVKCDVTVKPQITIFKKEYIKDAECYRTKQDCFTLFDVLNLKPYSLFTNKDNLLISSDEQTIKRSIKLSKVIPQEVTVTQSFCTVGNEINVRLINEDGEIRDSKILNIN